VASLRNFNRQNHSLEEIKAARVGGLFIP
jgi:hypothetical protein